MWMRTIDGWYVHELRGVCYVSFVQEKGQGKCRHIPKRYNRPLGRFSFFYDRFKT